METLQKERLSTKVCQQLIAFIEKNKLKPGDRLPTQKNLIDIMQISSASLREGLQYAEALGIIYTKHGSGSFVKATSVDDLFFPHKDSTMLSVVLLSEKEWSDLLEMRLILETAAVGLSIKKIKNCLPLLKNQIELMEATGQDTEAFAEADINFHQIIIQAVGNNILEHVYSNMRDLIRRLQLTILQTSNENRRSIAGHRDIYRSLAKEDSKGAQEAMAKHLRWASEIQRHSPERE